MIKLFRQSGLGAAMALGPRAGNLAMRWPASLLFSEILIAPARPCELALTFDDGPNPAWTPRLLDMLASHNVLASFFLVGSRAQTEPALVRRIAAEGHLIGNHSWSHPNLAQCSEQLIHEELMQTNDTLEQITGEPVRYFRPPFGAWRPAVLRTARSLNLRTALWNAMTGDWNETSADHIAKHLTNKIDRATSSGRATNIVLHDGGHLEREADRGPSVRAAGLLAAKHKTNYRFVKLSMWA